MKSIIGTVNSAILVVAFLSGCSPNPRNAIAVYPVSGEVLWEGKPAFMATVIFHPSGNSEGQFSVKPRGKVKNDGTFELTTFEANDGAPEGEYAVTFELWLASGRDGEVPVNRLPQKFSDPKLSTVHVTVTATINQLRPIYLKR